MASAEAVARYFLWLAASEPEEEPVTHMRLQKLLYYAQGWSLGTTDRPLFDGNIEAWPHGPVAADLYSTFSRWTSDPVPHHEAREGLELLPSERALINWVWAIYGQFSASRLRSMTHNEAPWREAGGGCGLGRARISERAMREHFRSMHVQGCKTAGVDAEQLAGAFREIRSGRAIPWSEFVREFAGDVAR
jgi:uncharacterized phage-associated protein